MSDESEETEVDTAVSVPAPEKDDDASDITPQTRRAIIYSLAVIALVAIIAEAVIVLVGDTASEALLTVAATAVGGLAGLAMPGRN